MTNRNEERPLKPRHFTIEEAINLQGAMIAELGGDEYQVDRPGVFGKVTGYSRFVSEGLPGYALEVHWDHHAHHSDYAEGGSLYFDQLAKGGGFRLLEGDEAVNAEAAWRSVAPDIWRGGGPSSRSNALQERQQLEAQINRVTGVGKGLGF